VNLGKVGIWTAQLDFVSADVVRDTVRMLEDLGYGAIWVGENVGREPIAQAGLILAATDQLVVATGIMNIWARDPAATAAAQLALAEAYPDRFLLGLGASHARLVEETRGHAYARPLQKMRDYLTAMDRFAERYRAVRPSSPPLRVLAALGPRMLSLAAELTDGAHTYFVPPQHTANARAALGDGKLLAVEQAVVLETDPDKARAVARTHTRRYLPLTNYTNNLRRLGFDTTDFDHDGSDRLVDAIVAWGDLETITRRVEEHRDAGADHVCLQVINQYFRKQPTQAWNDLAQALCTSSI
jgi:probable F420-dependent oxidoreductase